jgi:3-oxoacyl-[acyl-carrier protein] reductase
MGRLNGKKILVTGGSRGIGAGIATHLASEGAQVAITYSRHKEAAEDVLKSLSGKGHMIIEMNVASEESVEKGMTEVFQNFGNLDGLVNNAGITKDQLLLRMKTEDFDAVINTNLRGCFLCTKFVVKPMMKARAGSIVNITSVIGHSGNAGQANYAASKAGIEAFSRSVAQEFGSRNIRSNSVAPGFIQTEMTEVLPDTQKNAILQKVPLQKFGEVKEVAHAVSFLLSDESSYITGQTIHVNGGMLM